LAVGAKGKSRWARGAARPNMGSMKTATALTAALLLIAFSGASRAHSSVASGTGLQSAKASIDFAIRIPRVARLRELDTPPAIAITAEDVARGYVRVKARLELVVNDPRGYVLAARLDDPAFSGFRLEGLGMPVEASGASNVMQMPPDRRLRSLAPVEVSYELRIAPRAVPGTRPWPLRLRLQSN
jgi:hypothetical protein